MPNIGYTISPGIGGTSTFYTMLRESLKQHGWEMFALCTRPVDHLEGSVVNDFISDKNCIIIDGESFCEKAEDLINICKRYNLFGLIVTDDRIGTATIPHLPTSTRVIVRSNGIHPLGYQLDTYHYPYVDSYVVTTPRQKKDLMMKHGVDNDKIWLIPHGVEDFLKVSGRNIKYNKNDRLEMLYLGRIYDKVKNALILPNILKNTNTFLHIVGTGPDENKLKEKINILNLQDRCTFYGSVKRDMLPKILPAVDILLLPSDYEGFGISLIEAMSSGIVPISTKISGVTDWIIKDGYSGYTCNTGSVERFVEKINYLNSNRDILHRLKINARNDYEKRFKSSQMSQRYSDLLATFTGLPYIDKDLEIKLFDSSICTVNNYKKYLPKSLKNLYSTLRYRVFKGLSRG